MLPELFWPLPPLQLPNPGEFGQQKHVNVTFLKRERGRLLLLSTLSSLFLSYSEQEQAFSLKGRFAPILTFFLYARQVCQFFVAFPHFEFGFNTFGGAKPPNLTRFELDKKIAPRCQGGRAGSLALAQRLCPLLRYCRPLLPNHLQDYQAEVRCCSL